MKDIPDEELYDQMNEASEWQELPELELFDDELSFVKKHDAQPLDELDETDNLEQDLPNEELSDISVDDKFDELKLSGFSNLKKAPSTQQINREVNESQSPATSIDNMHSEQLLSCITQLSEQVSHLAEQIEALKTKHITVNPQKLFASGVYYAKHKNYVHAAKWFRRAALAGHAKAMFYLGTMFLKAEGLPQSLIHGYVWMTLAGVYCANEAKAVQQDLQKHLTAKEINLAQRLAADKYEEIEDSLLLQQTE